MSWRFTPSVHRARDVHDSSVATLIHRPDHHSLWVPCRPLVCYRNPLEDLWMRLRLAFLVLIGRYDALDWEDRYKVNRE